MDALTVCADEVVPFGQRLAERCKAVAAGVGQPVEFHHILGRDLDAIRHIFLAVGVIAALVRVEA